MTAAELQKAIDRAGHSQSSAARELGISRRMLMYYLSGKYEIPRVIELAVKALPAPHKTNRR
jgi:predicted transcriptional regulator